jgi:hypothetical protein
MKPIILICLAAISAACLTPSRAQSLTSGMPAPNFSNLPQYQIELQQSRDPRAQAILMEIANGPQDLAREMAAAKSEGLRLDLASIDQAMPPANQNAAPIYEILRLGKPRKMGGLWPSWGPPRSIPTFGVIPPYANPLDAEYSYTPAQLGVVRKLFAEHASNLQLLDKAARLPKCVYPAPGPGELHASFAIDAAILTTESYLLAVDGKWDAAIKNQALGFRLADEAASVPGIAQLGIGEVTEVTTIRGFRNILCLAGLNHPAVDDEALSTMQARHSRLPLEYALRTSAAIQMSQSMSVTSINDEATTLDAAGNPRFSPFGQQPTDTQVFTTGQQIFIGDLYYAALADFIDRTRANMRIAALYTRTGRYTPSAINRNNPITVFSFMDMGPIIDTERQIAAKLQVTMASAAILAVRARTGSFLRALPRGFIDPFSGKPLGYRREGATGFVVYSVGQSGKFDGGNPGDPDPPAHFGSKAYFFRYPIKQIPVPPNMLQP